MNEIMRSNKWNGWRAALGSNVEAVAFYRITLGTMLLVELTTRFQYLHPFYSDEGTLPLRLLMPKTDSIYKVVCIHCYSGSMIYMQTLLSIQVMLAAMFLVGYKTKVASIGSWVLYFSLTLRNTWLNFILDRYFHHLLFYSMFLPLDQKWAVDSKPSTFVCKTFVSPCTLVLKLLITWLYWDAGYGKYSDPMHGWTLNAPISALDTYVRHTVGARFMYGLLGPTGLRYMTPTVVYAEMFCAPAALYGSVIGSKAMVYSVIILMCLMHIGIALTMRNTVVLSLVACCAWCIFLPEGLSNDIGLGHKLISGKMNDRPNTKFKTGLISTIIIAAFVSGSVWFEAFSEECNQSMKHIWSTLLHNRWNVFVGAEDYVTWEIAPGKLADGSIVDVWSKTNDVSWEMPGAGAPCTSTSRVGRWRSFPYLAGLDGDDGETLWSYLCRQWDEENEVDDENSGRKLLRFNFFMLQADVLPNMGFSATRKRLIHSHDCMSTSNFVEEKQEEDIAETFQFQARNGEL